MSKIAESKQLKEQLAIEVGGLIEVTSRQFEMADAILRDILSSDRPPAFEERTFFKARCGWTDDEVNRQIARMRSVMRHQATSGTLRQRESAYDEAERCQELLESEGPRLDAEIAKLQAERSSLDRNANRSQKRCEEIDEAVEQLKTLLRPDIASEHEQQLSNLREEFSDVASLSTEIQFRQVLLGTVPDDFNGRQRFCERVRMEFPDCIRPNVHKPGHLEFVEPNWTVRKVVLLKELGDMRVKLDELVAIRDKELSLVNEALDFYVLQ